MGDIILQDWSAYGVSDPEFDAAIAALPKPPVALKDVPIKDLRASTWQVPSPTQGVKEWDQLVPVRDGYKVNIRTYQPDPLPKEGCPLYIMYHGGGFVAGNADTENHSCRLSARALGFVVVSVEYRLAPEHPFPHAPNDAWDAFQWAVKSAKDLHADPSRALIVGGTSAGCNLANVVAHLARDEGEKLGLPKLHGVHLMVPGLFGNDKVKVPARYEGRCKSFADPRCQVGGFGKDAMELWRKMYNGDPESPLFYFFGHQKGHAGLPPHFFQIAGLDPLRDEGLLYEEILREESHVPTRANIYPGVSHGWWTMAPKIGATQKFMKDMESGVTWLRDHKR